MFKTVIFDIDGTITDSEDAVLNALRDTILEITGRHVDMEELQFSIGVPSKETLQQLGITDTETANRVWNGHMARYLHTVKVFDGIGEVVKELKNRGYKLGIITSKNRREYDQDFLPFGLGDYFDASVCVEDSESPKPSPAPMLKCLELTGTKPEEALYIGDTVFDLKCAAGAGVKFGLALWGCRNPEKITPDYYFNEPEDILKTVGTAEKQPGELPWVKFAMELQFLAQAGLAYSKDVFDIQRFERIRGISAEMISTGSGFSKEYVRDIFCNETGFQTPKLDTRAAIFRDGKILLVKENDGRWSLPGGWVDVNESIKTNTVKEVKEEAGLNVIPVKLIAVQDRKLHNRPLYAYGVLKAFVLCESIGGEFSENIETVESRYFSSDELPLLAEEKNTAEQVRMCFDACNDKERQTVFD